MNYSNVKPMRTAIIGCGSISDIFFKNFKERFKIIDLVACASKGMKSAEIKAEQYGVKACTVDEIMADPTIELIVNVTPAQAHYSIIKQALEAGKHVYTEKIITESYKKSQELYDLAREKGLWLGSEPDHFLGAAWQTAREQINGGMIGDVTLFREGNFEPTKVLPVYPFDHDSRGVGAAEMAWAIRLNRAPRAKASLGIHCQEILEGIKISGETGQIYNLTTSCEIPKPLPKGFRGKIPMFTYDEEGSLVL